MVVALAGGILGNVFGALNSVTAGAAAGHIYGGSSVDRAVDSLVEDHPDSETMEDLWSNKAVPVVETEPEHFKYRADV